MKKLSPQIIAIVLIAIALLVIIWFAINMDRPTEGDPGNFVKRYRQLDWTTISEIARDQVVYFHMWGGSEPINRYVNDYVAANLLTEAGITLEMVPLADTADAVNKILADKESRKESGGAIDLIWINGENFRTLREADALFGPFADLLPNRQYIAVDSPSLQFDYGYPIEDYESPWGGARVVFIYNSDTIADPPRTMDALLRWVENNPNRFTYPLPPDFVGSVFVRQVLYSVTPDINTLLMPFEARIYQQHSQALWDRLNAIEGSLWRSGTTYPETQAQLEQLFANGEVWFDISYNPAKAANLVEQGIYPESTRSYVLDSGTIGNTHYVAIPYNATNKAGAMVVANFLLSPAAQYEKNLPEVWGDPSALTLELLPADWRASFEALPTHPAAASPTELAKKALPELSADWLAAIETDWEAEVLLK